MQRPDNEQGTTNHTDIQNVLSTINTHNRASTDPSAFLTTHERFPDGEVFVENGEICEVVGFKFAEALEPE